MSNNNITNTIRINAGRNMNTSTMFCLCNINLLNICGGNVSSDNN